MKLNKLLDRLEFLGFDVSQYGNEIFISYTYLHELYAVIDGKIQLYSKPECLKLEIKTIENFNDIVRVKTILINYLLNK